MKTYKKCARLLPHLRPCKDCPHKNCAIRTKDLAEEIFDTAVMMNKVIQMQVR